MASYDPISPPVDLRDILQKYIPYIHSVKTLNPILHSKLLQFQEELTSWQRTRHPTASNTARETSCDVLMQITECHEVTKNMNAMMKLLHGTVANTILSSPRLTQDNSKELDTDVVCDHGGELLDPMYTYNLPKSVVIMAIC